MALAAACQLTFSGCSSSPTPVLHRLVLAQDTIVTVGDGTGGMRSRGETLDVGEDPVLLESPGHVGVLVVPIAIPQRDLKVSLKSLHEFGGAPLAQSTNAALIVILDRIYEVQRLLAQGKHDEAIQQADALVTANPGLAPLRLLKASCLMTRNDQQGARALVASVLSEFPGHRAALDLERVIGNPRPPPQTERKTP